MACCRSADANIRSPDAASSRAHDLVADDDDVDYRVVQFLIPSRHSAWAQHLNLKFRMTVHRFHKNIFCWRYSVKKAIILPYCRAMLIGRSLRYRQTIPAVLLYSCIVVLRRSEVRNRNTMAIISVSAATSTVGSDMRLVYPPAIERQRWSKNKLLLASNTDQVD